jgi:D-alanyl-D-alanine carboxypeptidase/D-alanyl-D-alanine-endopeptidase (penicillin-binding protein 4)
LYLRGGGDPSLSLEKWTSFLRRLRYSGIKTLRGDLVLDRSSFQPEREDLQATAFDEHPDAAYNVIPDALLLNHCVQFAIEPMANAYKPVCRRRWRMW